VEAELDAALDEALEVGYRHIDTAYVYENENVVGNVLRRWLDSGKLRREDLFIVTKVIYIW
jgi:diketogulonate reductase-like aldo/keto reductase